MTRNIVWHWILVLRLYRLVRFCQCKTLVFNTIDELDANGTVWRNGLLLLECELHLWKIYQFSIMKVVNDEKELDWVGWFVLLWLNHFKAGCFGTYMGLFWFSWGGARKVFDANWSIIIWLWCSKANGIICYYLFDFFINCTRQKSCWRWVQTMLCFSYWNTLLLFWWITETNSESFVIGYLKIWQIEEQFAACGIHRLSLLCFGCDSNLYEAMNLVTWKTMFALSNET